MVILCDFSIPILVIRILPVLPPGPPTITGSQNYYQLNQRLHLNCTTPLAKPAPALTWILNGHKVVSGGSVVMTEHVTSPAGLERVTTQLRLRVASHHFHSGAMTIVCEARVGALYTRSDQVEIREPSSRWFASPNLYHTTGTGMDSAPSLFNTSIWLLVITLLYRLML
ncbi:hypothetical protein Pcinc_004443 [Petrolisthes cinctipes]|uniref:CD80-like immunoglobulin C2-set domain-containing protein n=1 Tax=Petrolisthes cinctipes TaxID=88211 RepID=A0AAE1GGX4_PETCI|nr:hypothetical protein Pcinc_004443 [Petrolisthes cinctipes]